MDTARHFQSLRSIYTMVDSLPFSKINVLHWHMSDSQSFPMQSKTHPKREDTTRRPPARPPALDSPMAQTFLQRILVPRADMAR